MTRSTEKASFDTETEVREKEGYIDVYEYHFLLRSLFLQMSIADSMRMISGMDMGILCTTMEVWY
jgi:hypothetical protein